ncbi:PilW family protein [Rickettsiella endosymbiont of Miltochrista miniata]|uniref:PilW family protein n=1 Tax=Rickettsiella endosymbiont of Miltochrista miniata TaxID=3066239 RepID=UPI00313C21E7
MLELMLAISLSLFLSLGMMSIFIHSKNIYRLTQSLGTIPTKARMAFYLLSHDIRMAGFIGCVRLMDALPINSGLTGDTSLIVWHKGHTAAKLSLPKLARYQKDSDAILIQFLDPNTFPIKEAKSSRIILAHWKLFRPRDILLISDCQHAELIHWSDIHLAHSYQMDSEIGFFNKIIYYIADTGRVSETGQRIYALYRRNLNQSVYKPTELIEGINRMSIRLGIKNSDGILYYKNANEVKHWPDAHSVEIRLLLTDVKQLHREWKQVIGLRER